MERKRYIYDLMGMLVGVVCLLTMQVRSVQADYPQATTSPLTVNLDMNSKTLSNIGDLVTKGPWIDVRAYGATGDGVTDDTAAIQAAINAVPPGPSGAKIGSTVYFPTGIYLVSSPLTVNAHYITLQGASSGTQPGSSIIRRANGSNTPQIISAQPVGVTSGLAIVDLYLDGNKTNNPSGGDGIVTNNYNQISLQHVQVQSNPGNGIVIGSSVTAQIVELLSLNVGQNNKNGIQVNAVGVWMFGGDISGNGTTNDPNDSTGNNLYFNGGGESAFCGVAFDGSNGTVGRNGVALGGVSKISFQGCYVHYNRVSGYLITGGSLDITITGGEIIDNSQMGSGLGAAIRVGDTTNGLIVTGVRMTGPLSNGIVEFGSTNNNLYANNNLLGIGGGTVVWKVGANTIVRDNLGYVTENSGTATIASGQTTVNVTHGLTTTPTRVIVTPTTTTGGRYYWISTRDATTFTIRINSTYTSAITFDWRANVGEQ